jgi:hypothetical protein
MRMAQRCAYLVKIQNISSELIVNIDQNGTSFVPTNGPKTWEKKGLRHINVHGVEGKWPITIVASSSTKDNILPFQVIFQGLAKRSLLLLNDVCLDSR